MAKWFGPSKPLCRRRSTPWNSYRYVGWLVLLIGSCESATPPATLTTADRKHIRQAIQHEIDEGLAATRAKDIEGYMRQLPEGFVIYDESGEIISREQQRENALRDWSIIDTTLYIDVQVDSIDYPAPDSVIVYTSQRWERMMFRRDGITTDTVLTTQRHRETWKQHNRRWFGYEVEELGGQVFINGEEYRPG